MHRCFRSLLSLAHGCGGVSSVVSVCTVIAYGFSCCMTLSGCFVHVNSICYLVYQKNDLYSLMLTYVLQCCCAKYIATMCLKVCFTVLHVVILWLEIFVSVPFENYGSSHDSGVTPALWSMGCRPFVRGNLSYTVANLVP